jgi:hypothetical protein
MKLVLRPRCWGVLGDVDRRPRTAAQGEALDHAQGRQADSAAMPMAS